MTYGPMTPERWFQEGHKGKRVLLNGEDITDRCRWFNDETGEAECFVLPLMQTLDGEDVVTEMLRGTIEVRG